MELRLKEHCTEEVLELYALGRIDESRTVELEKHLLLCEPCRDRLNETGIFVRAMKGACAQLYGKDQIESSRVRIILQQYDVPAVPAGDWGF